MSFEHESVDELVTLYSDSFGPVVAARALAGDRWPEVRADLLVTFERWNSASDGSACVEAEYLVTVGRRPEH